jgi:hypothetical protein
MSDIDTIRRTLAVVRNERDWAHLLLRVLRHYDAIPDGPILREVNNCVAVESESDIEDWQRRVDRWITDHLERQP